MIDAHGKNPFQSAGYPGYGKIHLDALPVPEAVDEAMRTRLADPGRAAKTPRKVGRVRQSLARAAVHASPIAGTSAVHSGAWTTNGSLRCVVGHVFISYSHQQDSPYVQRLATHLTTAGLPVWYDKEIVHGDRWTNVIREMIDTCAAFIVVMTPDGEKSNWVDLEVARAFRMQRPILPLLLRGDVFFTLANVQYQDVSDGGMPGRAFTATLRTLVPLPRQPSADPALIEDLQHRHRHAHDVGEAGDWAEAVRLFRDLVADRTRLLGPDHPDTLTSRHDLALSAGRGGDPADAVRLYRDLVADRTRLLGPDHPDTLASRHQLANNVGKSGDRAEAIRLLRDLVVVGGYSARTTLTP